ncbi:hypothetical protein BMA10399_B1674 [Burkholderia mallei ATCC 10399]|nr:hypothetical protein BMAFMH_G0247 [Burkholderia mallei FMH]EDP87372.1 hypothetical protein BMA10399_B1674 [Burkholderia mallei ATCC 10399]
MYVSHGPHGRAAVRRGVLYVVRDCTCSPGMRGARAASSIVRAARLQCRA